MCGRFSLSVTAETLAEQLALEALPALEPRFNIAPTQESVVIRAREDGLREGAMMRWGLVPFWAKDRKIGSRMINARSETVAEKPAFRAAFTRRRCLVPADGFYEWRREEGRKQPYRVCLTDGTPFAMAGLWERWDKEPGEPLLSFTILTTEPNELVAPIHDRMPVILEPEDYATWLDPSVDDRGSLEALLDAYPAGAMEAYPVSTAVNSPANDDPRCIARLEG